MIYKTIIPLFNLIVRMSDSPDTSPPSVTSSSPRKMRIILGGLIVSFILSTSLLVWLTYRSPLSHSNPSLATSTPTNPDTTTPTAPSSPFTNLSNSFTALSRALSLHAATPAPTLIQPAPTISESEAPSAPLSKQSTVGPRDNNTQNTNAAVFSLLDLKETILSAAPYQKELRIVERYSKKYPSISPSLDVLKPYAAIGIPTLTMLQQELESLTTQITQTYLHAEQPDNVWGEITRYFLSHLTIRKIDVPETKTDPASVAARSLALAGKGHITKALALIHELPEPYRSDVASWTAHASAYVTAHQALDQLFETLRNE